MNKLMAVGIAGLLAASVWCVAEVTEGEKKPQDSFAIQAAEVQKPAKPKKAPLAVSDEVPLPHDLQRFARAEAFKNGVPYPIVLGVMEQESRFDITADGGDSFGLMQINECHGPRGIIMEPHENIRIGTWLLGYLYREYRDWNKVLVAYNCGEAGAEKMYFRHGSISSPYSREVMFRSEKFAKILGEESVLMPK